MLMKMMAWQKVILYIEEDNISRTAHKINMTYSHVVKIKNEMIKRNFLIVEKEGRANIAKLTDKGKKLQEACRTIANELRENTIVR